MKLSFAACEDILKTLEQLHFVLKTDGYERYENANYSFTDEAKVIDEVEIIEGLMSEMLK